MSKDFKDLLEIARSNVEHNPLIVREKTEVITNRYFKGLLDEVEEVKGEIRENNAVHLVDELSDIAWDYAVLLAILENRGLIEHTEDVLVHAHEKYTERTPAFLEGSKGLWEEVKQKQKDNLKKRHIEKYGR